MTITLTREEAQSVLDAVENIPHFHNAVIETLRARLSAPDPEPVAWHEPGSYSNVTVYKEWAKENGWLPLYTAPPQREWQGLTDEEIAQLMFKCDVIVTGPTQFDFARAIEAKLKEKNA